MDGMLGAIKNKRGGLLNDQEENAHQPPQESKPSKGPDMQGLVQSLSDDQKNQLLSLLVKDQSQDQPDGQMDNTQIQQGEMGPGEEAELGQEAMDDGSEHESEDQIMESMTSSADKGRVEQGANPRNLGERVKMNLAKKLKDKGKY